MNTKPSRKKNRLSFAKTQVRAPLPDLIETQGLSYNKFLQRDVPPDERKDTGLQIVFKEIFPIRDFSDVNSLEFVSYSLGTPKYTLQECIARGVTYQVSLTARIRLVLREADPDADDPHVVDIRESDVYLGEVPLMTENGSFVVNGSERVIVSQLHRSPGVIFLEKLLQTGRRTTTAQIIPYRGAWVEFEVDAKDHIYVRIDKRKKLPATVLLRALGWESDADILKLYAKTERLVFDGWRVTHVEAPAKQIKPGDLLNSSEFRQAKKDYPGIEAEKCYRVTAVTDKDCPLDVGQEISYGERIRLRRKWKGFETELLRRVLDLPNSRCEFVVGQILTDSEYEAACTRYGKTAFTVEKASSEDCEGRVCAEDVISQDTGEVLLTANTLLTKTELERLQESAVEALTVLDEVDCQHIRFLRNTLEQDRQADYPEQHSLKDAALLNIFRTLRPGEPASIENASKHLSWLLFDPHRYDLAVVGRYKLNKKFQDIAVYGEPPAETVRTLRPEDIAATLAYFLKVHNGLNPKDDLDHLGNRRVRVIGELLENQFRMGLFQIRRTTRERLSTASDIDKILPSTLVNPKPLMMALREFFGSNQLSQFMQQINPLDELTHKRRISAIGPGGLQRDRATAAVRDVHPTHYGRVCPLETPEGPSIGLIVSLACYGRINPYGFIETPYHKVEAGNDDKIKKGGDDSVVYLSADSEDTAYIAAKAIPRAANADVDAADRLLPVRTGEDVLSLPMESVNYIGVAPQQIVGVSAALVPFLEHEDANRALMGSNHQRQAVPLIRPEAPLVGTGMEEPAARYSGALITATRAGTVTSVSADEILIYTGETLHQDKGENTFSEMGYDIYKLQTFKRSNSGTCIHQRPIVAVGDKVEIGQVIADGTSTENGELALGRNVLCAYMPWGGHNYEDSILISEGLIKRDTFTSVHIEEFEVEARETKVGPEEITRDIPNVGEQQLTQLDEEGIIRIGSVVGTGSILVGKITPKGESEYGPEQKLLHAIFGEKVKEVKDASTYVRPGVEGVVIDVKVFSRKLDTAPRRGWSPSDSDPSIPEALHFESKRKQIEQTWREQLASIRHRKIEEIRKTLIGCELAAPLYVFAGPDTATPFADAGETLTAEILDTYISGFTADSYYTIIEDTVSESFRAETLYHVTEAPESIPTIAVHYPDFSVEEPVIADPDGNDGMIKDVSGPSHFDSETVNQLQAYFSRICAPLLENAEPILNEMIEPLRMLSDSVDVVLYGADTSAVAVAVCEEAHRDEGYHSEQLKEALTETGARFGVLITEENSEPDSWDFYELADNTELQPLARSEFEQAVVTQLETASNAPKKGQMLTQSEWEQFSQTYPDLQIEIFWRITQVFDDEFPLAVDQTVSDVEYQHIYKDFPERPIVSGQYLTPQERDSLALTAKDLKTENVWRVTTIFDPRCTLPLEEYVSDAEYQKARKTASLSFSDIRVTDVQAMEHIQRVEEMAQGRITDYTGERERALHQLEMGDELKPGVIKRVKVYVASKRPISVGDKMAGRYGNKGVVAKILPEEDMPYLPDGTPVELVLNPLGVPSRMNVGQILEIHLGWACHELGIRAESPVFDGATEEEIFEMLSKTDLPERSKQTGKSILYDGRTGEPFAQEVTVGHVYFLKLNHLVADKMHARSTGPYSLVTQQPLGGKAQHGGQRLGEMEVWALEAYGAAHTLQEMLTIKSDDTEGRRDIYETIVKGFNPPPPGTPESFKVLVRELQTLGIHVSLDKDSDDRED